MASTREEALDTLGLAGRTDADAAAIQQAFERLARRYPQANFPERFRRLLEARDHLLNAGRAWREQLESRTMGATWLLPHITSSEQYAPPELRQALQDLLRAGLLAEPLPLGLPEALLDRLLEIDPF